MTYNSKADERNGQFPMHTRSLNTNPDGAPIPGTGAFNPTGNLPTPYQTPTQVISPTTTPAAGAGGGLLGNLPLKDIKGWVDRLGGIEGIMSTVNKMSRIAQTFQQMSPMIKLLMGNLLKKSAGSTDKFNEDYKEYRRKRRRRGRRRGRRPPAHRRSGAVRRTGRGYAGRRTYRRSRRNGKRRR